MFRPGFRFPIFGSVLELFGTWQRYRAFIKESLPTEGITAGAAYDYFQGASLNMNWKLNLIKKRLDGGINPSNGFQVWINTDWEKNKFIRGLDPLDRTKTVGAGPAGPGGRFFRFHHDPIGSRERNLRRRGLAAAPVQISRS